ncbi:MAG: hypothetical protein ACLPVF_18345 [Acidimicrobiales bacterium]
MASDPEVLVAGNGSPRTTPDVSRRRFAWGCVVGTVVSGAAFAWMVTGGTFQFLQSSAFSNFYDAQARSLLRGTWSMPANVLSIEGIRTDGRTDMYYGPVPALLRIPVLIFTHRFDGRLTAPSLLLAFLVALIFTSLLSWRIRTMVRGPAEVGWREAVLAGALIVLVGLGSVFFFLAANTLVYEEAEMWGAALALGAFYALVGFLDDPRVGRLVAAGVLTTLSLLTRGSVGAGPVVAIGLALGVYLVAWLAGHAPRWRPLARQISRTCGVRVADSYGRFSAGLLAAMSIPVGLYVAINEVKFDTPFSIPLNHQVLSFENAHRKAVLAANGGSLFGLRFLPTNLLAFARPDALTATRTFPWIFFPGKALVLGHLLYDTRDWSSSVPASMPALFLLAVVGVVVVYRPRRSSDRAAPGSPPATPDPAPGVAALRLPLVGAAAGTIGILTIAFIAERYLADTMPLVILAALVGWHVVARRWAVFPRRARTAGLVLLAVLAVFELWTTFSLSLFYERGVGAVVDIPQRAGMVSFQEQVGQSLFGVPTPGVRFVSRLPSGASALDLAVVGNCAGVYQFTGESWSPVEIGAGGGARRLEVTFPRADLGRRQPLLVTGGATPRDVVAVTWVGGDLYRFSYQYAASLRGYRPTWVRGSPIVVAPGRPHVVQVDLDSLVHQIFITVDGSPAFALLNPVGPPTPLRLGSAPPSISTTPVFAGRIRTLAVPTPICHELQRTRSAATGRAGGA